LRRFLILSISGSCLHILIWAATHGQRISWEHSRPAKALNKELLPTLGRPTSAINGTLTPHNTTPSPPPQQKNRSSSTDFFFYLNSHAVIFFVCVITCRPKNIHRITFFIGSARPRNIT